MKIPGLYRYIEKTHVCELWNISNEGKIDWVGEIKLNDIVFLLLEEKQLPVNRSYLKVLLKNQIAWTECLYMVEDWFKLIEL